MSLTKTNIYVSPEQSQNSRIVPTSPLAVIGLFVELIRKRFNEDSGLPWVWNADIKKTKIAIEAAFSVNSEHRDFSPAIYIDKGDTVIGRTVLGDRVGVVQTTQQEAFFALATIPMEIEVISGSRGESAIIGDIVQYFILASSDLIQSKFNLHELTSPILQKTLPSERDQEVWTSAITFTVQFPVRWSSFPFKPLLQQIELDIETSGSTGSEYFQNIVHTYERPEPE